MPPVFLSVTIPKGQQWEVLPALCCLGRLDRRKSEEAYLLRVLLSTLCVVRQRLTPASSLYPPPPPNLTGPTDTHGTVSHWHPDIPNGEGRIAACGHRSHGAQHGPFLAPSIRAPLSHLEPALDDLAVVRAPVVLYTVLLPVRRPHRCLAYLPTTLVESVVRYCFQLKKGHCCWVGVGGGIGVEGIGTDGTVVLFRSRKEASRESNAGDFFFS